MFACSGGHIDIVRLMMERGEMQYDYSFELKRACRGEHRFTFEDCYKPKYYRHAMHHMKVIRLMIEKGVKDYDSCLEEACMSGYIDAVRLLLDCKGTR